MPDLTLEDIDLELTNFLRNHFFNMDEPELAEELERVIIPVQSLGGDLNAFSFMAFSMPRLTVEERSVIDLCNEKSYIFEYIDGSVKIVTDQFGKINWFYISGLKNLCEKMDALFDERRNAGNVKPFWGY